MQLHNEKVRKSKKDRLTFRFVQKKEKNVQKLSKVGNILSCLREKWKTSIDTKKEKEKGEKTSYLTFLLGSCETIIEASSLIAR